MLAHDWLTLQQMMLIGCNRSKQCRHVTVADVCMCSVMSLCMHTYWIILILT